jgi:hypothetical protein
MSHQIKPEDLKGYTHEFEIARSTNDKKSITAKYYADTNEVIYTVSYYDEDNKNTFESVELAEAIKEYNNN